MADLKRQIIEALNLKHLKPEDIGDDQLLFVDLNHHGGVSSIPPGESELAEGRLELLRNVDGMGLPGGSRGSPDASRVIATESSGQGW